MKLATIALATFLLQFSSLSTAGDIAYGTLKAVKVYDYPDAKITKLHFNSDATHMVEQSCNGTGIITHSLHGDTSQKWISLALSAYMSGKKVRAYTQTTGSCEVDLLTISDVYM